MERSDHHGRGSFNLCKIENWGIGNLLTFVSQQAHTAKSATQFFFYWRGGFSQ